MIWRGDFRFHVAQRRLLEARGLHMIQRPASGAFDLELCEPSRTVEKSFAVTTSEFFQHLQIPFALSFFGAIKNPRLAGFFLAEANHLYFALTQISQMRPTSLSNFMRNSGVVGPGQLI